MITDERLEELSNGDRIRKMTDEELANEIKRIAEWDRTQKKIADKHPEFYLNWVKSKQERKDK